MNKVRVLELFGGKGQGRMITTGNVSTEIFIGSGYEIERELK